MDTSKALIGSYRDMVNAGAIQDAFKFIRASGIKFSELHPDDAFLLGKLSAQGNDPELGLACMQRCYAAGVREPECIKYLADSYFRQGIYFLEAKILYDEYLRKIPGDTTALENRVSAALAAPDLKAVIVLAREAIGIIPERPAIWFALGKAQFHLDKIEEALRTALEALGRFPLDFRFHDLIKDICLDSGRIDSLIEHFETWTHKEPENSRFRSELSRAYEYAGRLEDAERALASCPSPAVAESDYIVSAQFEFAYRQGRYERIFEPATKLLTASSFSKPSDARGSIVEIIRRIKNVHLPSLRASIATGFDFQVDCSGIPASRQFAPNEYVEINSLVFGRQYCETFATISLPSIVASSGFETVRRDRNVVFVIYTTQDSLRYLRPALSFLDDRRLRYAINTKILDASSPGQSPSIMRGLTVVDSLERIVARNGVMAILYGDFVIGDDFGKLIDKLQQPGCCAVTHPRLATETTMTVLAEHLRSGFPGPKNRWIIDRCMSEFMHPGLRAALISDGNFLKIRQFPTHYIANKHRPCTVALKPDASLMDYLLKDRDEEERGLDRFIMAHDYYFLHWAKQLGTLNYIVDSDEFMFFELTSLGVRSDGLSQTHIPRHAFYRDWTKTLFDVDALWKRSAW